MSKKRRGQPQKPIEPAFTTRPFAALKGLHLPEEEARQAAASKATPPQKPRQDTAADELFRQAMAGVRPLDGVPHRTASPPPKNRPQAGSAGVTRPAPAQPRDEVLGRKTFLQELDRLKLDVRFEDRLPEEEELRPLAGNRLRQLKRGIIQLDRQLDLHGLTREEALAALPRFLAAARQAGEKAVLIITGQGLHSTEGPVLQQAVAGWLRDQGRGLVLEYAPAPRHLGGHGALVVFVRPLDKPSGEYL